MLVCTRQVTRRLLEPTTPPTLGWKGSKYCLSLTIFMVHLGPGSHFRVIILSGGCPCQCPPGYFSFSRDVLSPFSFRLVLRSYCGGSSWSSAQAFEDSIFVRDPALTTCCSHQPSTDLSQPISPILDLVSLVDYDSFSLPLLTW